MDILNVFGEINKFANKFRRGKVKEPTSIADKIINELWCSYESRTRRMKKLMKKFSDEQLQEIARTGNANGRSVAAQELRRRNK